MTRVKFWFGMMVAALIGVVGVAQQPVHAASGAKYTVSPVIPDNQRTNVSSYFDLVVKPGSTQNLTLGLTNATGSTRHLTLYLTTAFTQINGQIGYTPNGPKDSSAQYRLSDLGPAKQTVTLAGGQTKKVTTTIKIPAKGFKGVMLGGLYVVDQQKSSGGSSSGIKFKNQYATLVGVQLQTKSNSINQVKRDLKLTGVSGGIQSGQAGVIATVQNPTPTYWGKMAFNAKVTKRNSKTVIMHRKTTNYAMAPNSHFDFGILQNKALDPGDYTLDLLVTGPHGTWHFKRNFSILAEDANRINKKLGLKRQFVMPWWGWLLIGLGIAGLLWLLIFLIKRRKDKKDEATADERTRTGRRRR